MMMPLRVLKRLFFVCAPLFLGSCVSLTEMAGRALDGSAFAERTNAVYRTADPGIEIREVENRAGEQSVVIMAEEFPAVRFRGSSPDAAGAVHFTSMDYLSGNSHGWNEFRLDIFGQGIFQGGETEATFSVPDPIQMVQISSGRIRRYDTRITGEEALVSLRNRHNRMLALVEWMHSLDSEPPDVSLSDFKKFWRHPVVVKLFSLQKPEPLSVLAFEQYWKPILFPELTRKQDRPEGWLQEGDSRRRAEGIRWNESYTERVFPQLLWEVRNSGTMLRDWEEAFEWLFVMYHWDTIMETFAKETVLSKSKR
jgi:hypothetical protein